MASARQTDVTDVAWMSRPKGSRTLPFFADLSQCVSRTPWGTSLGTVCTSSIIYDFEKDSVISSDMLLGLMGFLPGSFDLSEVSASKQRRMIGEAIFVPNLTAAVMGVYLNPHNPLWRA